MPTLDILVWRVMSTVDQWLSEFKEEQFEERSGIKEFHLDCAESGEDWDEVKYQEYTEERTNT